MTKKEDDLLSDVVFDWGDIKCFADEILLAKFWLSKDDEEAFAYLQ